MSYIQDQRITSDVQIIINNNIIYKHSDVVFTKGTPKSVVGISAGGGLTGTAHSINIDETPAILKFSIPSNMTNSEIVDEWDGEIGTIAINIIDPITGASAEIAGASLTEKHDVNFGLDGRIELTFMGRYVA